MRHTATMVDVTLHSPEGEAKVRKDWKQSEETYLVMADPVVLVPEKTVLLFALC